MAKLQLNKITFAEYQYSVGDGVEWSWNGSSVYGQVRDRSKDSFTVDGNKITGDDGENVYKMEEYDKDSDEFTGQMVAKPESSLSSWQMPENMSAIASSVETMTFALDEGQKQEIYQMWSNTTNMTEEQMEMWDDAPCSDAGVMDGENIRDETLMLMGQAPDGWNQDSYMIANRHLSFIMKHSDKIDSDSMEGGEGSCPSEMAVAMLNRGMNPFGMMPSGNPNFSDKEPDSSFLNDISSLQFEKHADELDSVYSDWSDAVNMTASELERWAEHPCSDEGSQNPKQVRDRNMMLLETDKSDWGSKEIKAAKRTISFVNRMSSSENKPEDPASGNKGTCPSEWWISLLNWAYNPRDSLPDGEPNPDAEENSLSEANTIAFSARSIVPREVEIATDFNNYGIRKNTDKDGNLKSVDAVFEAMEPGEPDNRNGVRITSDFLQKVAEKDYDSNNPPFMLDHSKDTLSKIGEVKEVWFSEKRGKLMLITRVLNTGSDLHDDVINRFTHEPPQITNGSVGFGDNYEYSENDEGEVELTDGTIREFSTTPFPAGYESGGLVTNTDD